MDHRIVPVGAALGPPRGEAQVMCRPRKKRWGRLAGAGPTFHHLSAAIALRHAANRHGPGQAGPHIRRRRRPEAFRAGRSPRNPGQSRSCGRGPWPAHGDSRSSVPTRQADVAPFCRLA